MGKTISFVKGKGSISHNNRDFIAGNVDRDRMAWNEYYVQQPIKEVYQQIFGPAIAEYNAKQKRKDRQVTDYLTDIRNSGNINVNIKLYKSSKIKMYKFSNCPS